MRKMETRHDLLAQTILFRARWRVIWRSLCLWFLPGTAMSIPHAPQAMTFIFIPFIIALTLIIPFKIITFSKLIHKSTWCYVIPVILASAITVSLLLPLVMGTHLYMPFQPELSQRQMIICASILASIALCVDGAMILLVRLLFDPLERLLIGLFLCNLVLYAGLVGFGLSFWIAAPETYALLVTLVDGFLATVPALKLSMIF